MIDYIKLKYYIEIPTKYFSPLIWQQGKTDDGQFFRWRTVRHVKLRYYEESKLFTISGKIIRYLYDTQVQNVDDVYGARTDLFVEEINDALNRLFPSPILDIRNFIVTRIDYCINLETPYTQTYIEFMDRAFKITNNGTRVNYAEEHDLDGSVYVRTASDYKENSNKNYTLNFYNKAHQLQALMKEGAYISEVDLALAENILRLEVQCGYQMIRRLTQKFCIGNTFGELFDFRIAYEAIQSAYVLVLKGTEDADYYTYAEAKKQLKGKRKAQDVILVAASHRIMGSKYAYGRNQAKAAGVYPHCFLPKSKTLIHLDNPLKLLRDKLTKIRAL